MRAIGKLGRLVVRNFWWKLLALAVATVGGGVERAGAFHVSGGPGGV